MKLLLNTHTVLWPISSPEKLSRRVVEAVADPSNDLFVSIMSLWEIVIKTSKRKLQVSAGGVSELMLDLQRRGVQTLPMLEKHLAELDGLELLHNDPFDRLLVAQAIVEGMTFVTADRKLPDYDLNTLW